MSRSLARRRGGSGLEIAVAPLTLSGVGRAVYTVTVANTSGPVWSRTIDSDQFGDGRGSVTYVGPCDASVPAHTVTVLLSALYDESDSLIAATSYRNPTPAVVPATCAPNADTLVPINLTIMRDAQQGFFDIAVNFDDIFCSAKLDCEGDLGQDLKLLHRPGGGPRDTTLVLGFACTGGPGQSVDTHLYLDDLEITCTNAGFAATVDPSGGPGNVTPVVNTGGLLFGAAVYRGDEDIVSKAYWNVALGLNKPAAAGTCTLRTRASASDGPLEDNTTPNFTAYPFVEWDLEILAAGARTCTKHPIGSPEVAPAYTPIAATGRAFDHGYRRGSTGVVTPEGCTDCHVVSFAPEAIPTGTPTVVTLSGSFAAAGDCDDCELVTVPDAEPLIDAAFDPVAGTVTFTAPSDTADLEVQFLVGLDVVPLRRLEVDGEGRLVAVERDTIEIPRQAPVVTAVGGCVSDEPPYARDCDVSGNTLFIVGQNFGATATGVTVTVDGVPCTGVAVAMPHTQLVCTLAAGSGFDKDLTVTVGGRSGTLPGAVSYFGHTVFGPVGCTGCVQNNGRVIGDSASLSFDVFPPVAELASITAELGRDGVWTPCTVISLTPNGFQTTVVCQPAINGVGSLLGVRVRVGGVTSRELATDLRYREPQILTVTPLVGTLNGGEWVPLNVRYVGTVASALKLRYGPYTCGDVRIVSSVGVDAVIECATVPGTGGPHTFVITALNQSVGGGPASFTYPTIPSVTGVAGCPLIAGAGTAGCPTEGGTTLLVTGSDFSPTSTIWLGASSAGPVGFVSPTTLSFQLPAGVGSTELSVRQGAIVSLPLAGAVRYAVPTIAAVAGCTDLGPTTY
ncbi:MAG TPA: IPT/TIG domain-containing protein, partial [Myxococcota bacterium]|nr:IPT/TIG domain-containing protein [Myxococcota bacterium]